MSSNPDLIFCLQQDSESLDIMEVVNLGRERSAVWLTLANDRIALCHPRSPALMRLLLGSCARTTLRRRALILAIKSKSFLKVS
jgi:hypothetical protein